MILTSGAIVTLVPLVQRGLRIREYDSVQRLAWATKATVPGEGNLVKLRWGLQKAGRKGGGVKKGW